jgi:AcrR family transcriptional regulator
MQPVYSKKILTLLETARQLFWKHGLKRVSVEEICAQAGVSKMTFYRNFNNKTDLAKAVYTRVVEDSTRQFKIILHDKNTTASEKIEKMLRLKMEGTNDISREFLNDFYTSPEEGMMEFVHQKTHEIWMEMIADFKKAQKNGWFRKDFKPEAFFIISMRLSELFQDEKLLSLYNNPQELIMEMTRLLAYGINPHPSADNSKPL